LEGWGRKETSEKIWILVRGQSCEGAEGLKEENLRMKKTGGKKGGKVDEFSFPRGTVHNGMGGG